MNFISHIFISYSRKDSELVEKIVDVLAVDDLKPRIDWKSIPKGEEVQKEIYQAIEEVDIFLFFISPDSVRPKWRIDEIERAARNNKQILPIVIRDTDSKIIHSEISIGPLRICLLELPLSKEIQKNLADFPLWNGTIGSSSKAKSNFYFAL